MWCQIQIKSESILLCYTVQICMYRCINSLSLYISQMMGQGASSFWLWSCTNRTQTTKHLESYLNNKKSRIRRMQIQSEKHHHRLPLTPRLHFLAPDQQGKGVGDDGVPSWHARFTFCQMGRRQMGNADTEDGELKIMNIFVSFDFSFFSEKRVFLSVDFCHFSFCDLLPSLASDSSLGFSRVTVQLALSFSSVWEKKRSANRCLPGTWWPAIHWNKCLAFSIGCFFFKNFYGTNWLLFHQTPSLDLGGKDGLPFFCLFTDSNPMVNSSPFFKTSSNEKGLFFHRETPEMSDNDGGFKKFATHKLSEIHCSS